MAGTKHDHNGFALVFILWVMVLITVIGISFSYSLKIERQTTLNHTERFQAEAAALSGINRAILALLAHGGGPNLRNGNNTFYLTIGNFKVNASVKSPAGKIDINQAPLLILIELFDQFVPEQKAQRLAAAVLDWRDKDSITSPNGAEEDEYYQTGFGYKPSNEPFKSISELGRVMGFDDDLVLKITPYITIHSGTAKIDPLSAGATVLTALPAIDSTIAEAFIEAREEAIIQQIPVDLELLSEAAAYLSPGYYQGMVNIFSTARSISGETYRWEALIKLEQGNKRYEMLEWFASND